MPFELIQQLILALLTGDKAQCLIALGNLAVFVGEGNDVAALHQLPEDQFKILCSALAYPEIRQLFDLLEEKLQAADDAIAAANQVDPAKAASLAATASVIKAKLRIIYDQLLQLNTKEVSDGAS